jgi:hypothetical protein
LSALDAQRISAMKQRAHEAAEELSYERDEARMLALVAQAAGQA